MSGLTGDKGWNDPPAVSGMAGGSAGQSSSRLGNGGAPRCDSSIRNVHSSVELPGNQAQVSGATGSDVIDRSASESRQFILKQLSQRKEMCIPRLNARQATEMEQHMAILEEQLSANSLSVALEERLHKLLQALCDSDKSAVRRLQSDLVLNHASEISSWLIGMKRLVHESSKMLSS